MRPLFPQDVVEIVLEYAGNFADLLRLRQVSTVWREAACAVADFPRRTGSVLAQPPVWPHARSSNAPDPDFLTVHPTLVSVNAGMTAAHILRAAVVLIPATLDQLSVSDLGEWKALVDFVNRPSQTPGRLANLTCLRFAATGCGDVVAAFPSASLHTVCPHLRSLSFDPSTTSVPAAFVGNLSKMCSLTAVSLACGDACKSPSAGAQIEAALRELPLLQSVELNASDGSSQTPFEFTLTPEGWPHLRVLNLFGGIITNLRDRGLRFPPSIRELTVDCLPPEPYLPPSLTALAVREGSIHSSCLAQVPELQKLSCRTLRLLEPHYRAAVERVLGGLVDLFWNSDRVRRCARSPSSCPPALCFRTSDARIWRSSSCDLQSV
jgi:hypothetical protein